MRILLATYLTLFSISIFAIDYSNLDPLKLVPQKLLIKAVDYYNNHPDKINNKSVIAIIDFRPHNSKERLFLIDIETGEVEKFLVAHGKNSDKNYDGLADSFSNKVDSLQSSLGFYITAETYDGNNGYSLRLDGLEDSNSNARTRAIVMHGADYVKPGAKIGRSSGCPAVEIRYHSYIIDKIKNGALLFAAFE